jgi:hypothetical protein
MQVCVGRRRVTQVKGRQESKGKDKKVKEKK